MFINVLKMFYEANAGGGGGGGQSNGDGGGDGDQGALTFDAWFEKQDPTIKGLLDGHTKGLRSALETERENRKGLEKQVRDLAAKAEKGSDAEKQLTGFADKLAEADRKADFYDAAHKAGVTNLKLAYITAVTDDLFDKKGSVNFETMKKAYPELFGTKKTPAGNAGDGTEGGTNVAADMNARIRRQAGRVTV